MMNSIDFHEKLVKVAYDYRAAHGAFPASILVRKERIDDYPQGLLTFIERGNPTVGDFVLGSTPQPGKVIVPQQHQISLEQTDGSILCTSDDIFVLVDGKMVNSELIAAQKH